MGKLNVKMLRALCGERSRGVEVLCLLSKTKKALTANEIINKSGLRGDYVSDKVLPALLEVGWVERTDKKPYRYRIASPRKICKRVFGSDLR